MEETFFIWPGEGERVGSSGHRVLAELPQIEALELSFGPDFEGVDPHTHSDHADSFYVLEGELTFWVGGQIIVAGAGSFVYGPRDIPHTFTVSSDTARFLLVTEPAGFESFMRSLSEPAVELVIPAPATEPPDVEAMTRLAADYGIEILGPPGIPA